MAKIAKLSTDSLKEGYKNSEGHYPSYLGELFGWSGNEIAYDVCELFAEGFASLMPDYFPFSVLEGVLVAVCKVVYDSLGQFGYTIFAARGDNVDYEFKKTIDDMTAKIKNEAEALRSQIQHDVIDPLKSQAYWLTVDINKAKAELTTVNDQIEKAKKTLTDHGLRIDILEQKVGEDSIRTEILKVMEKLT